MVQHPFSKKTITIIGLGSVGTILANRLLRLGCSLRIIDRDRIYEEELARQDLYTKSLINKFKAKEAKKILDNFDPESTVKAFHEDLMEENSFLLQGELIIDASNDIKTNKIVQKKAETEKLKVIQINYAGTDAVIKFYEGKTKDSEFKNTIKDKGCAPELPDLASGIAMHIAGQIFSGKKPKPEYRLDTKKLIIK